MKNPLNKRLPREFCRDIGKYLVIFLFMLLLIGLVSGFLVTDNSFKFVYDRNISEKKVEDGHMSFSEELSAELKEEIETEADITIHNLFYFEEALKGTQKNIRVYQTDRDVNLMDLMSGEYPAKDNEIALDRMFAKNNDIAPGDTITLRDRELLVTGLIASPDYSCLFENNADMMFDSINFSIAVMTPEGFRAFESSHVSYNYAWLYPEFIDREDKAAAKEKSEDLIKSLKNVLTAHAMEQLTASSPEDAASLPELTDYLPRYLNQAINFTGDDMGSDKAMILVIDYIITLVLAFVFAITISSTIVSEAGVIGTLRASGFKRSELLRHYMILPFLVSLVAAVLGNIAGYTVCAKLFQTIYYNSYSLAPYETLWNADAFFLTTIVPLVLMAFINFLVLFRKLRLSPLNFLRHDLSRRKRKKALRLNTKIPFIHRFRMRILLQNLPNYLTLFLGILIGGTLLVFGSMFKPLLLDYKEIIVNDRICDYQYVLSDPEETDNPQAEKYLMTSLKTMDKSFKEDEVSVFGIWDDSAYVSAEFSADQIAVSYSLSAKYGIEAGDTLKLKDPYDESEVFTFSVSSVYDFQSQMAIFLPRDLYLETFNEKADAFTGYFSNEELTDLDSDHIAATLTVDALTKVSDQLLVSMGNMMGIFDVAGVLLFALLMYLLSKQILEKNASSISMTKILGFRDSEIGRLYIVATSLVVVLSLLISVPLIDGMLRIIFTSYLYTEMTGYIPYIISNSCYVKMFVLGVLCYGLISLLQMRKIRRIPKSDALKNME
ncbi:MAG: ABC transporter permease [Eubacteriales bacterium]|nr:ABC transporter permease [Eubacteriales bacterium]